LGAVDLRNKTHKAFEQMKFALRCKYWRKDIGECGYEGECYCVMVLSENVRLKEELASTWKQNMVGALPNE